MFGKSKSWMGGSGGVWKPKNPHSLEHLKYLHGVLCKNQAVTEQNPSLLVETLRSISEILIWGDQNDGSVFDFFLEKNMLLFFLRFMRQKSGHTICVQLLQTLNILFDNISNETSVYYLLSNNHINSIIVHKFDFSDEEVMAYYISFLKTLSLKLNKHTIHFFYNEHTNDFALYTEAIKFFNHPESMVRIAVRTITLNVYRACRFTSQLDESGQPIVDDRCMLRYIRDKTAAPYFSNLVYFIGDHVLTLDACVRNDIDHNSRNRLADLVAEHLDQLHYLNDILCLKIEALNEVLCCHLLDRLLIPLYISSLRQQPPADDTREVDQPRLRPSVALFLLSQVLLILNHPSLVSRLAEIIFGDAADDTGVAGQQEPVHLRGFVKPEPLAETLDRTQHGPYADFQAKESELGRSVQDSVPVEDPVPSETSDAGTEEEVHEEASASETSTALPDVASLSPSALSVDPHPNSTDEEKLLQHSAASVHPEFSLRDRPYLSAILAALDCTVDDYEALFALCLLYALGHNYGIDETVMDSVNLPTDKSETKHHYNMLLVQQLIQIMSLSCQSGSKVRLATLELTVRLLRSLVYKDGHCFLQDCHLAAVEGVREEATLQLRNFYKVWEKSEEIFLDMFEDEYRELSSRPLNVEYMTMDASILLPPTGTPLTGIDFSKRLPCGEVERARRAIRVFFLIRDLSYMLRQEQESELPLTKDEECVKVNDVLDLNNSDLIACTIVTGEKKERRFLVIDILQLILVEPDSRRLGWGVVRFVGFLQDVEVTGDRDDSRCLHVTIHKPTMNFTHGRPLPILSARFIFDDHIRCMAAKQRLTKGRLKARQRKMQMIAYLLDLPAHLIDSLYPQAAVLQSAAALRASHPGQAVPGGSLPAQHIPGRSRAVAANNGESASKQNSSNSSVERSVFASVDQVPAFNAARELEQGSRRSASKVSGTVSSQVPTKAFRSKTTEGEAQTASDVKRSAKLLLMMAKEAKRTRQQRTKTDEAGRDVGPYPELRRIRQGIEKSGSPRQSREKNSGPPEDGGAPRVEAVLDRASSLPESSAQDGSTGCLRVQSLDVVRDAETKVAEESDQRLDTAEAGGQRAEEERKLPPQQKSAGAPKSLLPAEGTPVSLVVPCDEVPLIPPLGFMDSPVKLVPPVEHDDIHRITSAPPSNSDGNSADQRETDLAERSEETLVGK